MLRRRSASVLCHCAEVRAWHLMDAADGFC
jgi:hypothetical protein